jgi:hypothetical protein
MAAVLFCWDALSLKNSLITLFSNISSQVHQDGRCSFFTGMLTSSTKLA